MIFGAAIAAAQVERDGDLAYDGPWREGQLTRLTVKYEGDNSWLTPIEDDADSIPNHAARKFVAVER